MYSVNDFVPRLRERVEELGYSVRRVSINQDVITVRARDEVLRRREGFYVDVGSLDEWAWDDPLSVLRAL